MAVSILGDREFEKVPSTKNKVLRVNLNENIYGTFAEIGAGQETVPLQRQCLPMTRILVTLSTV